MFIVCHKLKRAIARAAGVRLGITDSSITLQDLVSNSSVLLSTSDTSAGALQYPTPWAWPRGEQRERAHPEHTTLKGKTDSIGFISLDIGSLEE